MVTQVTHVEDVAVLLPSPRGLELYVISLSDLRTILKRSCNTWSDIPFSVLSLSDSVDEIIKYKDQH